MQCYSMMIITECLLDAIMAKVDVIVAIQPTFCLTPYVVFQKPRCKEMVFGMKLCVGIRAYSKAEPGALPSVKNYVNIFPSIPTKSCLDKNRRN